MQTKMQTSMTQWSKITRWLHALIAITIIGQLISSLILVPPDEMEGASFLGKMAMETHEIVGLTAALLLFLHWLWSFISSSDIKLSKLFPLTVNGYRRSVAEISYLLKHKKLPSTDTANSGNLASLFHGIGIIVASIAAFSGTGLYYVMDFTAKGFENPLFEEVAEVHETFANLMWLYLIIHVLAAMWHEYSDERIIKLMFRF